MQKRLMSSISLLALLIAIGGCTGPSIGPDQPAVISGLQKGDDIESWNPIHVAGPNKGTNACPVCTYMTLPAVVIFTKDGPNLPALAVRLQDLVNRKKDTQLKGFVVVLDSTPDRLRQMAGDAGITQIGICYPDPVERDHDLQIYKINPQADNTVMVYKNYKVTANFVNLDPADFDRVVAAVNGLN
jgi:protocatechuate 3,4-dioxygenase, beta subunit